VWYNATTVASMGYLAHLPHGIYLYARWLCLAANFRERAFYVVG
jgi:hypothetical protein